MSRPRWKTLTSIPHKQNIHLYSFTPPRNLFSISSCAFLSSALSLYLQFPILYIYIIYFSLVFLFCHFPLTSLYSWLYSLTLSLSTNQFPLHHSITHALSRSMRATPFQSPPCGATRSIAVQQTFPTKPHTLIILFCSVRVHSSPILLHVTSFVLIYFINWFIYFIYSLL